MIKASEHTRAAEAYDFVWRMLRRWIKWSGYGVANFSASDVLAWIDEQYYRHTRLAEREARRKTAPAACGCFLGIPPRHSLGCPFFGQHPGNFYGKSIMEEELERREARTAAEPPRQ